MKKLLVTLATVLGILAVSLPAHAATPGHPAIRFVGDSITVGSTPDILSYFGGSYRAPGAPAYHVTVHAVSGSDTYADAHFVYGDSTARPTVEVINLGTNDSDHIGAAWRGESAQTADAVFHRLNVFDSKKLFPHTCVVFVNINTHTQSWNPTNAALINAHLAKFQHVVDWNGAYNPAYFDGTDNVHPNELGRHVLVHMIDAVVATCPH